MKVRKVRLNAPKGGHYRGLPRCPDSERRRSPSRVRRRRHLRTLEQIGDRVVHAREWIHQRATLPHNASDDMSQERDLLCTLIREPAQAAARITPAILEAAREERVHLLLAHRLRLPAFDDDRRAAAAVEAARQSELRRVLGALAGAGVRPVLIKGASIAYTHYVRPELRPSADADLMVPPDSRRAVERALTAIGYRQPLESMGDLMSGQFHFQKRSRAGLEQALDVHWRISNVRAFADALSYEEIARDAVPVPPLGPHALGTSAVHALLVACTHRVAHHADSDAPLWLFDIHLLARGCGAAERAVLVDLAYARRMRAVCARGLQLADAAFGGIDAGWIGELAAAGGDVEPSAAFLGGGMRPVDILRANLAATPRWRGRVQLLREHVFPSSTFMYERYRMRRPIALPFLYLHRLLSGLPKWFRR